MKPKLTEAMSRLYPERDYPHVKVLLDEIEELNEQVVKLNNMNNNLENVSMHLLDLLTKIKKCGNVERVRMLIDEFAERVK